MVSCISDNKHSSDAKVMGSILTAWNMPSMQIVALSESDSQKIIHIQQKYFLVVKSYAFDLILLCLVTITVSHQPRDRLQKTIVFVNVRHLFCSLQWGHPT